MEEEFRSATAEVHEAEPDAPETQDAEVDRLAKEVAELQDQVKRSRAEFDNFRKRRDREQLEFAEYAGTEIVRALLPALDDFERALKAASGTESELTKGIELIYNRLLDTLKKQGLEAIPTADQKFDPNLHHAIKMVQNDELADHTILQEYQRGYNFKGRLLRAAMVEVSVKP